MSKQLVFGTYRPERLLSAENYPDGISRNGVYTPATYLNNQFGDWNAAWLTNCVDDAIQEERYTGEIVPGVRKLTRLIVGEYESLHVDPSLFKESVARVGAKWDISMFADANEAAQWVRDNTDLEEVEPGKFLIAPESENPMTHEVIPAKYLIIV